jgi:hypothetical protein
MAREHAREPITLSDCVAAAVPASAGATLVKSAAPSPLTAAATARASEAPSKPRRPHAQALTDFGPRSPLTRSPVWLAEAQRGPSLLDTGLGRR